MSNEFEALRKAMDEAIEKAVKAHSIAINDLTEQQTVEVFKQAIACGDIRRLVRVDNAAQTVIYIPFQRDQELEFKLARAKLVLQQCRDVIDRNQGQPKGGLIENIDACLNEA